MSFGNNRALTGISKDGLALVSFSSGRAISIVSACSLVEKLKWLGASVILGVYKRSIKSSSMQVIDHLQPTTVQGLWQVKLNTPLEWYGASQFLQGNAN